MGNDAVLISREPAEVVLAGSRFLLPYAPAGQWIVNLDWLDTLAARMATPADREAMTDLVLDEPNGRDLLRDASRQLLSAVCRRPWWEAYRLLDLSVSPQGLGHLALAGMRPWDCAVGEWCAATYALYTRDADEKALVQFDFRLSIPPRDHRDNGWGDDRGDDPEEIERAMAKMGGGSGVTSRH